MVKWIFSAVNTYFVRKIAYEIDVEAKVLAAYKDFAADAACVALDEWDALQIREEELIAQRKDPADDPTLSFWLDLNEQPVRNIFQLRQGPYTVLWHRDLGHLTVTALTVFHLDELTKQMERELRKQLDRDMASRGLKW